jgi:hypothetical protein
MFASWPMGNPGWARRRGERDHQSQARLLEAIRNGF